MTLDDMTREEKVIIYVLGKSARLIEAGVLTPISKLTPDGLRLHAELMRAQFKPTKEELSEAVNATLRLNEGRFFIGSPPEDKK